jgi:hypothetical protein
VRLRFVRNRQEAAFQTPSSCPRFTQVKVAPFAGIGRASESRRV